MRRENLLLVAYCLLSFSTVPLCARPTQQYRRWVQGIFDLPGEIAKAANVSQLQPFLESDREFTRMAAVRRLGEIEGPQAISRLLEVFRKEKPTVGMDSAPLAKVEVVRTLGRIGTDRSRLALLGILNGYWRQGPGVKDKRGYGRDRDFACVVPAALRTIAPWGNDPAVFEMLQSMALSNDVRDFYTDPHGLGETIWQAYLKSKITREEMTEGEQSLTYLLDFMYAVPKPISHGTFGHIQYRAAFNVLQEHSESALSALAAQLTKELLEEDTKGPDEIVWERVTGLSFRRGCLRAALRQKAKLSEQKSKAGPS